MMKFHSENKRNKPFKIEAVTRMVLADTQIVANVYVESDPAKLSGNSPGKRKIPMSLPRVRFLERPEVG